MAGYAKWGHDPMCLVD